MRGQTITFIQKLMERHTPKNVIDVGSLHINGNIRNVFTPEVKYFGIDMRNGENVDLVLNGHDIKKKLKKESYDTVCCFDMFEHDSKFWITLENCKWLLKKGGYLLIGVPGRACPAHDYPSDYWRFMPEGVKEMFEGMDDVYIEFQKDDNNHIEFDEIYGWGKKT